MGAKQLLQEEAIKDVISEGTEKQNKQLLGECLLETQLLLKIVLGGHLF